MAIEDSLYPLLTLYLSSPDWIRNSVGRAYSIVPLSMRRGRHYTRFLMEAAITDEKKIAQISRCKLASTLRVALESVPAYRPYRSLASRLDAPHEALHELPLISKEDIKLDTSRYLSTSVSKYRRLLTATGGSTSTPMVFFLHKGMSRSREYAYMDNFHARVGLRQNDIVLALRGRSVPTASRAGGRLWMYEAIKRQLILSSDYLERRHMPEYMKAIRIFRPVFIQAYPSTIYPLARWLKENPAPDIVQLIRGIMLYSENVLEHHMALLKEVFQCPVLKHYGHSERVLAAASMPDDDRYFFWPQYGHVELVDEAGQIITKPGVLGEIVGTGFDNHVMPFVRYRTGDLAILSERPHPSLPGFTAMQSIEGRRQEFLVCRDHRLIAVCGMGAAHSPDFSLLDSMQFEQSRPGHLVVRVVASQRLPKDASTRIARALEIKTQGGCTVELVQVAEISRTLRGKHRLLVQHLDISKYLGAPICL